MEGLAFAGSWGAKDVTGVGEVGEVGDVIDVKGSEGVGFSITP